MKILVIGPSWVGDMMMSQSLYRTLKDLYPNAEIDVMAPAWCRPLLAKMPEVNPALAMPLGHGVLAVGERRRLGITLRENKYDRAYVLPNSFKSALVPFFANIPLRTGWRGEMRYGLLNDIRTLDKNAFPLMVQRYVALAYDAKNIR
ncbi:lipopolysaccharide heptosyltransferase II, partial [Xenorhabdus bovienii]|uniref:lipopolysaccharide heptosyltransferase II n=1 Tax=Xenorhabdus bovienii TaxID=40576 RepID=UPI0023B2DBCF